MKFGCCTTMEYYELLEQTGYDYIELAGKVVAAMDEETFEHCKQTIAKGKVKCCGFNAYCGVELNIAGGCFDEDAIRAYGKKVMARGAALGIGAVGVGSPLSRMLPEGFDTEIAREQLKRFLEITCKEARAYHINVLLEAVCTRETNYLNTIREAYEVVKSLSIPNLHLVYDIYHAHVMQEGDDVMETVFDAVRHIHVCGDVGEKRPYLSWDNTEGYEGEMKKALALGYHHIISVEAFEGDVKEGVKNSIAVLRKLTGS